jgi:hypothetical protein
MRGIREIEGAAGKTARLAGGRLAGDFVAYFHFLFN